MLKENVAICIDITSLAFMLVLFTAGFFVGWKNNLRGRLFLSMTGVWAIALLADAIAWNADLTPSVTAVDWTFSILSCCVSEAEAVLFVYYLLTLAKERGKEFKTSLGRIAMVINTVGLVLTLVFAAIGKLYIPEDGKLLPGEYYTIVGLTPIITVIGVMMFVISKRRILGTRVVVTAMVYVALPMVGYILEAVILDWFPASMCMNSLALMLVYIVLQSHEIDATRERERILKELSAIDVMTGANNRRAYHERVTSVKPDEMICAIFCDMNALKYTNDNFGHESGDQLLKDFADMLSRRFGKEDVYRISGDEFVVLFDASDESAAMEQVNTFRAEINENDTIASLGAAYGSGQQIQQVLDNAEKLMYEDKDGYYERTGKPRRH